MRCMKRTIILHMSDLHFGIPERRQSAADRTEMLDSFLKCYKDLLQKRPNLAPDILVLSGDIAWSGSESDYEAAEDFFNRFLSVPGNKIMPSQVVACFGNHDKCTDPYLRPAPDSNTAAFDQHLGVYIRRPDEDIKDSPEERALKDVYALMPTDVEKYFHCFQNAEKFCNNMNFINLKLPAVKSQYKHAYGLCKVNGIEFIVLNSEWDFWGKEDKCAENRLRLGLKLCQTAKLKPLQPFIYGTPPRFVVFHRSLEHLHIMEQPTLELSISDKCVGNIIQLNDVTLNGHEHTYHIKKCGAHTDIMAGTIHSTDSCEFSCNLIAIPAKLQSGLNPCEVRKFSYSPENVFAPWHIESKGESFNIVRLTSSDRISDFLNAMALLSDMTQKQTGKQVIARIYSSLTPEEKEILITILSEEVFQEALGFAEKSKQTGSLKNVFQTNKYQSEDSVPDAVMMPDTDKSLSDVEQEQEKSQDMTKVLTLKGSEKGKAQAEGVTPYRNQTEKNDTKQ